MCSGIFVLVLAAFAAALAFRPVTKPNTPVEFAFVIVSLLFGPLHVLWGMWSTISCVLAMQLLFHSPVFFASIVLLTIAQLSLGIGITVRAVQMISAKTVDEKRSDVLLSIAGVAALVALASIVATLI